LAVKQPRETPVDTARRYVSDNIRLFALKDVIGELVHERTDVDSLGMTHVRFLQYHQGIPPVGAAALCTHGTQRPVAVDQLFHPSNTDKVT
jgi:hypothetical protein